MSSDDLEKRRLARLRTFAISQAMERFNTDYPGFKPEDTVASICAYEEEGNIGDVLAKMPDAIEGDEARDSSQQSVDQVSVNCKICDSKLKAKTLTC